MAITVSKAKEQAEYKRTTGVIKGKREVESRMNDNLENEFKKLNLINNIDFSLFKNILYTTKESKIILTLGHNSESFNDTMILKTIYPIEKYKIKFIAFGNLHDISKSFILMYDFLNNESNNKNYKFVNKESEKKHLTIKPHSDNLFAITHNIKIIYEKMHKYNNFLFYLYKSIHGYFLQEELLKRVYENLKFDNNFNPIEHLSDFTVKSDSKALFKKIALLISDTHENVLKNSSIQLRDNESFRIELDKLIIQ